MRTFLIIIVSLFICSCAAVRKSSKLASDSSQQKNINQQVDETTNTTIEHFGDTLKGRVPLPELSTKPLKYVFRSKGTLLNLELTDTELKYKSSSHLSGKTTINKHLKTDTKATTTKEQQIKTDERLKTSWRPPWWLSGVLVVVILIIYKFRKVIIPL